MYHALEVLNSTFLASTQSNHKKLVMDPYKHACTHHLSLSFAPAENVELLRTSPISSRQKLKLLIVHM